MKKRGLRQEIIARSAFQVRQAPRPVDQPPHGHLRRGGEDILREDHRKRQDGETPLRHVPVVNHVSTRCRLLFTN